jgi:hypothetical protein
MESVTAVENRDKAALVAVQGLEMSIKQERSVAARLE